MNRAEKRAKMKKDPAYRRSVKAARVVDKKMDEIMKREIEKQTRLQMKSFEKELWKKWRENDETLNEGDRDYDYDGEDEIYND